MNTSGTSEDASYGHKNVGLAWFYTKEYGGEGGDFFSVAKTGLFLIGSRETK